MTDHSANNKRIAKNTMMLYFRMLISMLVSLYTSRVVLNTLGVEDYGIYNVVGGVVALFSVLSGSLSAAISRFITFELGKGDEKKLNEVFSSALTIQFILSLIIVVLAEIIGIWFLNNKMNIPDERMYAANWVFQLSLVNFVIGLISVPYNATIIAHERMSAFAYISILQVFCNLAVAYLLMIATMDKLIFYSIALCIVSLIIRIIYGVYCKKHFAECSYHFSLDKKLLYKMFGFAGWNFIGASSAVLRDQGGNIIINLFCGLTANAARSIAGRVYSALASFAGNFMTALSPQITKSYARGEYDYMMSLIFKGARFSFYILLFVSLPILVDTHYILSLWLGIVPEHTVNFVRLMIIFGLSDSISNPLITSMLATGNIRNYQLLVGGLQMMNLPISYILLRNFNYPEIVFIVAIILSQGCLAVRLILLRSMIKLKAREFLKKVWLNVVKVSCVAIALPLWLEYITEESFFRFIWLLLVCVLCTAIVELYIGCNAKERTFVFDKVKTVIKKFAHKEND